MDQPLAHETALTDERPQGYTPYSPHSASSASPSYSVFSVQAPASHQQTLQAKGRSQSAGQASAPIFVDRSASMSPIRPSTSRSLRDSGLVDKDGVPITYTPTTHRISKAKKGKKVHVCEYGCGKVSFRADISLLVLIGSRSLRAQSIESEPPNAAGGCDSNANLSQTP